MPSNWSTKVRSNEEKGDVQLTKEPSSEEDCDSKKQSDKTFILNRYHLF